jgi:hypothetical protein
MSSAKSARKVLFTPLAALARFSLRARAHRLDGIHNDTQEEIWLNR